MAKLADLRKKAKEMGIAPSLIRGATSAAELQEIIADNSPTKSSSKKGAKAKVSKKAAAKKSSAKTTKAKGNSKGKSKSASSKSAPANKSGKGKAKRPTAAHDDDSGRNLLGKINYNDDDGWNPREGSAPDRIVKALKKFKGDREKVFQLLKKDVWDFVGKKMKDGTKRPLRGDKWGAEEMLRYRIARTDWDFAMRTGQHEKSENRVEYGEGGTGEGIYNGKAKGKGKAKQAASKAKTSKTKSKVKSTKGKTTKKGSKGKKK